MNVVKMDEAYESSLLDAGAIRGYAREVSNRLTATYPASIKPTGSNRSILAGWLLGYIRGEAIRDGKACFDTGDLVFLRCDGELLSGEYMLSPLVGGDPDDPLSTAEYELNRMEDQELTMLDRPNFGNWVSMPSQLYPGRERLELGRNYQLVVDAKGRGLLNALRELDEHPRPPKNAVTSEGWTEPQVDRSKIYEAKKEGVRQAIFRLGQNAFFLGAICLFFLANVFISEVVFPDQYPDGSYKAVAGGFALLVIGLFVIDLLFAFQKESFSELEHGRGGLIWGFIVGFILFAFLGLGEFASGNGVFFAVPLMSLSGYLVAMAWARKRSSKRVHFPG